MCKLLEVAAGAVRTDDAYDFPLASIVGITERYVGANGTTQAISDAATKLINEFKRPEPGYGWAGEGADWRNLRHRLEKLTLGEPVTLIEPGEAWSDQALADLRAMSPEEREHWLALFAYARTATQSQPTKRFIKEAARLLEPIGLSSFRTRLATWIPETNNRRTEPKEHRAPTFGAFPDPNLLLAADHIDLWKGLVWCCAAFDDDHLTALLGQLADHMYRKIPLHGARAPKVGNACVSVFALKADQASIAQLERLRSKIKKKSIRQQIDRAVARAADNRGMTEEDLAETSIPTHGLQTGGVLEQQLGDVTARLTIVGPAATRLEFVQPTGKVQKTAPATVKTPSKATTSSQSSSAKPSSSPTTRRSSTRSSSVKLSEGTDLTR